MYKFLIFLFPLVAAFGWMEFHLAKVPNNFSVKKQLVEASLSQVQTLIVGPSHAYWGVRPFELSSNALNLAMLSQLPEEDAILLKHYVPLMPRLKQVIFPLSYFSLETTRASSTEPWRKFFYSHFFHLADGQNLAEWLDLRNYSLFFLYGRETAFQLARSRFTIGLADVMDSKGWTRNERLPSEAVLTAAQADERFALFSKGMALAHVEENRRHLEEVTHLASRYHVELDFVTLPVSKIFQSQAALAVRTRIQDTVEKIKLTEPGAAVFYHDFFADPRFSDSDFADVDHLNGQGSLKFSRYLDQEVVRPLFSEKKI